MKMMDNKRKNSTAKPWTFFTIGLILHVAVLFSFGFGAGTQFGTNQETQNHLQENILIDQEKPDNDWQV